MAWWKCVWPGTKSRNKLTLETPIWTVAHTRMLIQRYRHIVAWDQKKLAGSSGGVKWWELSRAEQVQSAEHKVGIGFRSLSLSCRIIPCQRSRE